MHDMGFYGKLWKTMDLGWVTFQKLIQLHFGSGDDARIDQLLCNAST